MATALGQEDNGNDNQSLSCALCKQELNNPKLLFCQHSFCTQCLIQHYRDDNEAKPFCCPTCQSVFQLEDDTIDSLPDNYLYDIVTEADGRGAHANARCNPCKEGNQTRNATHKCLDCRDVLCRSCSTWHCRFAATKHHIVVALTDLRKGNFKAEMSIRKVLYCGHHSTDEHKVPLSSYCEICKRLVCIECIQGDHNDHSFAKIHMVRETHQRSCGQKITSLEKSRRDQDKRIENIEKAITDTKQTWVHQETDMYERATLLHAMIDKRKEENITDLKSYYEKELQHLNGLLEEERAKRSCLQATIAFSKMFLEQCSDSDFLFYENDVMTRISKSQLFSNKHFKRHLVTIEKRDIKSITQILQDVLGRFETQIQHVQHKCAIGPVKEIFKRKIDLFHIYGLHYDSQSDEIIVAGQAKDDVIVVLNNNGFPKREIQGKEFGRSFNITMNQSHMFATVYLRQYRKVLKIHKTGEITKSTCLPDDDQNTNGPLALAVDDRNTMYIVSNATDRIYKWNPDEEKLISIILEQTGPKWNSPTCICLTPRGLLVVSNCKSSSLNIYSKEGELQWQYDGKKEGHPLNEPEGVCCDEGGYIYVLDKGNCRIQVIYEKELVGIVPIDGEIKEQSFVPLIITPGGDLIYGYVNNLVKISFWE